MQHVWCNLQRQLAPSRSASKIVAIFTKMVHSLCNNCANKGKLEASTPQLLESTMCAPSPVPTRVMIVDDNSEGLMLWAALLTANGCVVNAASDPNTALASAPEFCPDVLITDVAMPGMLGVELACKVVEAVPTCRVVFHTGESLLIRDCDLGSALPGFTVLEKPVAAGDLLREVIEYPVRRRPPVSSRVRRRANQKFKRHA